MKIRITKKKTNHRIRLEQSTRQKVKKEVKESLQKKKKLKVEKTKGPVFSSFSLLLQINYSSFPESFLNSNFF